MRRRPYTSRTREVDQVLHWSLDCDCNDCKVISSQPNLDQRLPTKSLCAMPWSSPKFVTSLCIDDSSLCTNPPEHGFSIRVSTSTLALELGFNTPPPPHPRAKALPDPTGQGVDALPRMVRSPQLSGNFFKDVVSRNTATHVFIMKIYEIVSQELEAESPLRNIILPDSALLGPLQQLSSAL